MDNRFYVYVLTGDKREFEVDATDNIRQTLSRRRMSTIPDGEGSARQLVYYESFEDSDQAHGRMRQLKRATYDDLLCLIHCRNPRWEDLSKNWR